MNTLRILAKEFKQNARDGKANIMMVLFPVVVMIILGAAFSGAFGSSVDLSNVRVLYSINSSHQLSEGFKGFADEVGRELGIVFEETADENEGIKSISDGTYSCFIALDGNPDAIRLHKNARYDFEANMVESLLKTFIKRYDAISVIAVENPAALGGIMSDTSMDYTEIHSLDGKRRPGSLDYYGVTMLTLILMYASMTGFYGIKSEQNMKTGGRILCAPIRKHEMLIGKVLGGIAVTLAQAGIVIVFSKYVLNVNWGNDITAVILPVITESIMAVSLGTATAFLFKNEGTAVGILNTIIPVVVFFGGGYIPLSNLGQGILKISAISPLKWTNDAIFRIIYNSDYSILPTAILINLGAAAVLIAIAALCSRREGV